MDIFTTGGDELGDVPLSEKQLATLESGAEVVVQYRTPQLRHAALGVISGAFTLRKEGQRIVTAEPDAVKQCVNLLRAARETT